MHQAWARALKASSDYDDGDDSHSDDSDMSDWDVSDDWDGMDSDDGDSEDRFDSSGKQPMPPVLSPGCPPEEVCHLGLAGEHQEEVLLAADTHRRRLVAIALANLEAGNPGTEHRKPSTFTWADHVAQLSERGFKLRYRMDSYSFYALLAILMPGLEGNEKKRAQARCGVPIEPD